MGDFCAPCKVAIQIHHGIQRLHAYITEKREFKKSVPVLLERQYHAGNLEPLQPSSGQTGSTSGWIMTSKGVNVVFNIYPDIYMALQRYGLVASPEALAALGLDTRLTVHPHGAKGGSVRKRIGERWPARVSEQILPSETENPFKSLPRMKWLGTARLAMGLLRKASRSEMVDLFMSRLLGLAQLCGIGDGGVDYDDLMELAVQSSFYEKLARACVAALVGTIDKTVVANLGLGPLVNGQPLGSTENFGTGFAKKAGTMKGPLWQIGTVFQGNVHVTYPKPQEQLNSITFKFRKETAPKEGEPVLMVAGWAACMGLRPLPGPNHQGNYAVMRHDIHGSPLYGFPTPSTLTVSVKRLPDGRLLGKPSTFGLRRSPEVTGQGVFGQNCGCRAAIPQRRLDGLYVQGSGLRVNGVELRTYNKSLSGTEPRFDLVYVLWNAGDVLMQVFEADAYSHSTYVQGYGECLWCAVQKTLGTGCWFLVAGGR